jgi:hypothetical protein
MTSREGPLEVRRGEVNTQSFPMPSSMTRGPPLTTISVLRCNLSPWGTGGAGIQHPWGRTRLRLTIGRASSPGGEASSYRARSPTLSSSTPPTTIVVMPGGGTVGQKRYHRPRPNNTRRRGGTKLLGSSMRTSGSHRRRPDICATLRGGLGSLRGLTLSSLKNHLLTRVRGSMLTLIWMGLKLMYSHNNISIPTKTKILMSLT